jgi:hypothetical protein
MATNIPVRLMGAAVVSVRSLAHHTAAADHALLNAAE